MYRRHREMSVATLRINFPKCSCRRQVAAKFSTVWRPWRLPKWGCYFVSVAISKSPESDSQSLATSATGRRKPTTAWSKRAAAESAACSEKRFAARPARSACVVVVDGQGDRDPGRRQPRNQPGLREGLQKGPIVVAASRRIIGTDFVLTANGGAHDDDRFGAGSWWSGTV